MTTPSKTWVRLRVPSITWKWTRRRSPAWKDGTRRSWARSRASMTEDIRGEWAQADVGRAAGWMVAERLRRRSAGVGRPAGRLWAGGLRAGGLRAGRLGALVRPIARLLLAPAANLLMVAGAQDVGHAPAAVVGRSRVVRVLGPPLQRHREPLLLRRRAVAQRAAQLAQHRVAEGRVVNLAAAQRRVLARVERAELMPCRERVGDVALRLKPLKPTRKQRDDIDAQSGPLSPAAHRARRAAPPRRPRGSPHRRRSGARRCRWPAPRLRPSARAAPPPRAPRTTAARAGPRPSPTSARPRS